MKKITPWDLEAMFCEDFDSLHELVNISIYSYSPSHVLRATDRIVYDQEFEQWLSHMVRDGFIADDGEDYYLTGE